MLHGLLICSMRSYQPSDGATGLFASLGRVLPPAGDVRTGQCHPRPAPTAAGWRRDSRARPGGTAPAVDHTQRTSQACACLPLTPEVGTSVPAWNCWISSNKPAPIHTGSDGDTQRNVTSIIQEKVFSSLFVCCLFFVSIFLKFFIAVCFRHLPFFFNVLCMIQCCHFIHFTIWDDALVIDALFDILTSVFDIVWYILNTCTVAMPFCPCLNCIDAI